jgi:hypothetical protein
MNMRDIEYKLDTIYSAKLLGPDQQTAIYSALLIIRELRCNLQYDAKNTNVNDILHKLVALRENLT